MARISTRIGAIAAAAAVLTLAAVPAFGAAGDVTGAKSNDTGGNPVPDGGTVNYSVHLSNATGSDQNNLEVRDFMDPGLVYVPQSTVVTGEIFDYGEVAFDDLPQDGVLARTDYDFDSGNYWWDTWSEFNDPAADPDSGFVRRTGSPLDPYAIGITSSGPSQADPLANPAIIRTIDPAQLTDLVDATIYFETRDQNLEAADTLGVWVSTDGGATWSVPTSYVRVDGVGNRGFSLQPYLPATSLTVRFGISAGDYTSDATWDAGDELWTVNNISIEGLYGFHYVYDNAPGGYSDLLDGTAAPGWLVTPGDNLDLPAMITYNTVDYPSTYDITYAATVDTSATTNYTTVLENDVSWRSSTYPADTYNGAASYVTVQYAPAIDIAVTSNSPVSTGQPIVLTIVLKHGASSDGSPVCVANSGLNFPAGYTLATWNSVGGDNDQCLEAGETWTFTRTYPPHATSGVVNFAAVVHGYSLNTTDGDDPDVTVNASTDVTVVLAETGPANVTAAGFSAAAMIAMGVGMLVVARRRTA